MSAIDLGILKQTVDTLIKKDLPFAVYQFPGEDKVCLVVQTEKVHFIFDIKELCQRQGFVVAPFESVISETAYFMEPDLFGCSTQDFERIADVISSFPNKKNIRDDVENHVMDKREYFEIANFLIQQLQSGNLDKIVLSRVIKHQLPKRFSVGDFFIKLKNKYPDTFVYVFNIPESGLWVGATPETLLKKNASGDVEIMSLAGTALKPPPGGKVVWGEKEKKEQQFVTDYIRLKVTGLGIKNFEVKGPETVYAGHLAHLQTTFKLPAGLMKDKVGELVKRMHPTPAVCGLSKVDAYHFIEKAELHDRKYYTGYIGPWGLGGKNHLFVNLRCAEIKNGHIFLYVGGGLTEDSDPEKEWNETEQKAKTLLNVLFEDKTLAN